MKKREERDERTFDSSWCSIGLKKRIVPKDTFEEMFDTHRITSIDQFSGQMRLTRTINQIRHWQHSTTEENTSHSEEHSNLMEEELEWCSSYSLLQQSVSILLCLLLRLRRDDLHHLHRLLLHLLLLLLREKKYSNDHEIPLFFPFPQEIDSNSTTNANKRQSSFTSWTNLSLSLLHWI